MNALVTTQARRSPRFSLVPINQCKILSELQTNRQVSCHPSLPTNEPTHVQLCVLPVVFGGRIFATMGAISSAVRQWWLSFVVLKDCPRELWLLFACKVLESFGYFAMSINFTIYLSEAFGFTDVRAGVIYGCVLRVERVRVAVCSSRVRRCCSLQSTMTIQLDVFSVFCGGPCEPQAAVLPLAFMFDGFLSNLTSCRSKSSIHELESGDF